MRQLLPSLNPITAALDQYFIGPNAQEQARGLIAVRNGFVNYRRLALANGVLRVYLDGQCLANGTSYSIAQPLIVTLKQLPDVTYVKLFDEHDRTRDPLGQNDSWPICLDPSSTPAVTRTLAPGPSGTPTAAPSLTPLSSQTATPTHGIPSNARFTPVSTQTMTPRPSGVPSSAPLATSSLTATVTPTRTLAASATSTPSLTATPTTTATSTIDPGCNRAKFINDVTIVDNSILHLGETFVKTWGIKNAGTCPWTVAYKLVFAGGDKMAGPDSVPLPMDIAPDQTVDISVSLSAPTVPGQYQGFWLLQSPEGRNFGVGGSATVHLWVKVTVIAPALNTLTPTPEISPAWPTSISNPVAQPTGSLEVAADFVGDACAAQWQSADGTLACPGREGDPHGFVVPMDHATLEDGTTAPLPALLSYPSSSTDGYIGGIYPEYVVQPGDHFQASVGCEFNALSCSVLFRLSYMDTGGAAHDLWKLGKFYDGTYFNQDLDLSQLAGQKIRFVLSVSNLGSARDDRALWVAPRIVRFQAAAPTEIETSTRTLPGATPTPSLTAIAQPTRRAPPTAFLTPTPPALQTSVPVIVQTAVPAAGNPQPLPTIQHVLELLISLIRSLAGAK